MNEPTAPDLIEDEHIALTEAHTESEEQVSPELTSSLGDTALNQAPAEDKLVQDVGTAWDMAHAGKPMRDKASYQRARATEIGDGIAELPAAAEELRQPAEQWADSQKTFSSLHKDSPDWEAAVAKDDEIVAALDAIIASKNPQIRMALEDIVSALNQERRRNHLDGYEQSYEDMVDRQKNNLSIGQSHVARNAERDDAAAERLEDWARVLSEQPLSPAYKERFGLEDVTPGMLVKIEDEIKFKQERLDSTLEEFPYLEEVGPQSSQMDWFVRRLDVLGMSGKDVDPATLGGLVYAPDSKEYLEYDRVLNDPQSSPEERQVQYTAAFEQYLKGITLDMKLKKTFLEDIRTGRANMWQ